MAADEDLPSTSAAAALRWQRLSALFDEALDLEPGPRTPWLAALQQREPELGAALLRLLQAEATDATHDPLAQLPVLGERRAPDAQHGLAAGQRVGPWSLLSLLGSGGMSVVWLAERADGAYERQVALKLPQRLPWRDDLAARLARERDILARLTHPHIAQLYDAGVTEQALPWLAMECVHGLPLTDWCDQQGQTLRQRVQLFGQVLDAVSHAHGALVLHRDLKPSNILVTPEGTVKLLDFGIAKLLDEQARTTEDTQLTQLGGRAMTPDYASPEQIRGDPLTTASDVYSLGVVLYELLCGQRPYQLRHRSAAQLETAVLDLEPSRPSSRTGSAAIASARGQSPKRLSSALRGELDAIVLMALRKSPAQRYPSAAALRSDLQRWLDGEPVSARPDSLWYRSSRFVVRHRVGVGLSAVVASVLVGSTLVSVHQSQVAQRETGRAKATRDFLLGIYKPVSWLDANPAWGGQVTARELLDLSAERLRQHPIPDAEVNLDVHKLLARLYADVGDIAARTRIATNLVQDTRRVFGARSLAHAEALMLEADARFAQNQDAARASLAQAQQVLTQLATVPASVEGFYLLLEASLSEAQSPADAAAHFARAQRALEQAHADTELRVRAMVGHARALTLGVPRLPQARALYEQVVTLIRSDPAMPVLAITEPQAGLADVNARLGHYQKALALYREAHERSEQLLGPSHLDSLQTGYRLGLTLWQVGRPREALDVLEHTRQLAVRSQGVLDGYTLPSIDIERGNSLSLLGRFADAGQAYAEAMTGLDRLYGDKPTYWRALWLSRMAAAQATGGDILASRATLRRARADLEQLGPSSRLEELIAQAAAIVAVAAVQDEASLAVAMAALDDWAQRELRQSSTLSTAVQQRNKARLALWRVDAHLLAGQPTAAAAQLSLAQAALTPDVMAEFGGLEAGRAAVRASELALLTGDRAQACRDAERAGQWLDSPAPGSPDQQQAARVRRACAGGEPTGLPRLGPSLWRTHWVQGDRLLRSGKSSGQ
jgi:eukaryotic-like serine/threonine-protein kinase